MTLSNKYYNILKPIALIDLPAAATLYAALAGIWHLPAVEQVIGSISAVDTFLGAALHLSSSSYTPPADGQLVIDKSNPAKNMYALELTTPLGDLEGKNAIILNVAKGAVQQIVKP